MMARVSKPALLGLAILLCSCAWLAPRPALPVFLPSAGDMLNQRYAYRVVWQDTHTTETFLAVMETHERHVQLVALLPAGITLFSLDQAPGSQVIETSPLLNNRISPAALLSLLQLASYPAETLASMLEPGWTLAMSGTQRLLQFEGTHLIRISAGESPAEPTLAEHLDAGYTVTMEWLGKEPIP